MDSLATKVAAFALPAIGLFFGQSSFRNAPQELQPVPLVSTETNQVSILNPEQATLVRLPDDVADRIDALLDRQDIVSKNESNSLQIIPVAEKQLQQSDIEFAYLKRLPKIEVDIETADLEPTLDLLPIDPPLEIETQQAQQNAATDRSNSLEQDEAAYSQPLFEKAFTNAEPVVPKSAAAEPVVAESVAAVPVVDSPVAHSPAVPPVVSNRFDSTVAESTPEEKMTDEVVNVASAPTFTPPSTSYTSVLADLPEPPSADTTPVLDVAPQQPTIQPAPRVARATQHGQWSPVDIRSVDVDTSVNQETQKTAKQATRADKLQAKKAVQLGFELVQRRAHYSARARFIQALRVVSRSLDDQTYTTRHSDALRNALAAYEEVTDFYPHSARPDEDVNLHVVIGGHKTPVLEHADSGSLTPRQCVREYMAYAEQEFAVALGNEGFASQALYGLGRLEASKETTSSTSSQVRANRSLMLYQTAMIVDQRNFAAANELGVLLAQYGKYENAVEALRLCVAHSPQPTAWRNLSNILRRMGRPEEAQLAEVEAQRSLAMASNAPFVAAQPKVQWVDNGTFASMNRNANLQVAQKQPAVAPSAARPAEKGSGWNRLLNFGR